MHPAGVAILVIVLLLIAGGVGWILFTRIRAQRLGLSPPPLASYLPFSKSSAPSYGPPQPAPSGIVGWFNDRIRMFKNRNNRTAAGAYEQPMPAAGGRGFGPLDPDEAWDSRVGPGGYYEEQELGLAGSHHDNNYNTSYMGVGPRGGTSYPMNLAATPGVPPAGFGGDDDEHRGRPRSRSPGKNPFEDAAEASNMSLKGVSPRPMDGGQ